MRYEGTVYRPPSEAGSLLIQATIGCPHNRCAFCGMYRNKKFRIRPVGEVKEDLDMALAHYGSRVENIFFPDGNTIFMKTEQLVEILEYARKVFPCLARMTVYGSAKFLKLKTAQELHRLREAGLTRIHAGMESGSDLILARINKGFTASEMIECGVKVREAGIELSEYILIGIGGPEHSSEHALESARVLNAITPEFTRLRTINPVRGTPLYEEYKQGRFQLLSPHQALRETKLLIGNLTGPGELLSDHVSNYGWVNGKLPQDKQEMLAVLDKLLHLPKSEFRQVDPRFM